MAVDFDELGQAAVTQGGVTEIAGDPREVQVAGGSAALGPIIKQIFRSTKDLGEEADLRATGENPLITDALKQPDLTDPNFNPDDFLKSLEAQPDPLTDAPTTRAGSPLSRDKGINFKWFDFGADSDPLKAINMVADKLPKPKTVTQQQTAEKAKKALAEELDILPDLLTNKLGLNSRNITAARMLLAKSSQRLLQFAEEAKGQDVTALLNFRRQALIHRGLVMSVRGLRAEAGRTLNSLRMAVSDADADQAVMMLDEFGGRKQTQAMADMYLKMRKEKGEAAANRFVNQAAVVRTLAQMQEIMVHGFLSNPTTLEKVALGNMQAFFLQTGDDFFSGIFGLLPRGADKSRAYLLSPAVRMYAWAESFQDAAAAAYRVLKTGDPVDAIGRLDGAAPMRALDRSAYSASAQDSIWATATHYFGQVIRATVDRGFGSADAFTRVMMANGEKNVAAYETMMEMRKMGASQQEILDEGARIKLNPELAQFTSSQKIMERMTQKAQQATLTEPIGKTLQNFGQPWRLFDQNTVYGRIFSLGGMAYNTFWRVTVRAFTETYRRVPGVGLMIPSQFRAVFMKGGAARDKALGQQAFGAMVMASLFQQALKGNITGAGPRGDIADRLRKQGIKLPPKFSIYLGKDENGKDVYRSYSGFEPFGGIIAAAATAAEAYKFGEPEGEEWEEVLTSLTLLPFEYAGELPMARQLVNIVGVFRTMFDGSKTTDDVAAALDPVLTQGAATLPDSVIPFSSVRRALNREQDPLARELSGSPTKASPVRVSPFFRTYEQALKRYQLSDPTAISNENLPLQRNIFGEPVFRTEERNFGNLFQPFKKSLAGLDDVESVYAMLAEANNALPFSKPPYHLGGIRITGEMHAKWMENIGNLNPRRRLKDIIENDKEFREAFADIPMRTDDMAKILSSEYENIKYEAAQKTFGFDFTERREGASAFVGNSPYDEIGQALQKLKSLRDKGLPSRGIFND